MSTRIPSALRANLHAQSSAGLVLMGAAVLALFIANSSLGRGYEALLHAYVGPLSLGHWINDGLMAIFFLLVGLEIKREVLDGELSSWSRRALPGIAAIGGMITPAIVYLAFNTGPTAHGWAIPAATDIAFALGVISLLGKRVPISLRIFLTALAIIDDLGAVIIIALFYTAGISVPELIGATGVIAILFGMNRLGSKWLSPYVILGVLLWVLVLRSGIHATLAGVILAFAIPLRVSPGAPEDRENSLLHKLEHALHLPVSFLVVPVFGLANAGVRFIGLPAQALIEPLTLGVALGLLIGKVVGVFGFSMIAIRLGIAHMPARAGKLHMLGLALLCGIGFTMSLFIALLALPGAPILQAEAKIGILVGSLMAGLLGSSIIMLASYQGGEPEHA